MTRSFAKLPALALPIILAAATPAFADTTPAGVAQDTQSVQQDNADINKDSSDLAKDRAAKAADKANGNWGSQAVDSMKIGVDKTKQSIHGTAKTSDTDTLNSDANKAAAQTPSGQPVQPTAQ